MNIAVLISIRPKWCGEIIPGKKKIDVRKTRPNLLTPFKCYIYETRTGLRSKSYENDILVPYKYAGKVIGEFVCDKIFDIYEFSGSRFWLNEALLKDTCLSYDEIKKYAGNAEEIYGWHISDLKIYDTPKELSEFKGVCKHMDRDCCACQFFDYNAMDCMSRKITRPPQSFMYVEELT